MLKRREMDHQARNKGLSQTRSCRHGHARLQPTSPFCSHRKHLPRTLLELSDIMKLKVSHHQPPHMHPPLTITPPPPPPPPPRQPLDHKHHLTSSPLPIYLTLSRPSQAPTSHYCSDLTLNMTLCKLNNGTPS